jgi:hypothetical protein
MRKWMERSASARRADMMMVVVVFVFVGGTDAARIYLGSATIKWVTNLPMLRFTEHASRGKQCAGSGR